MAIYDAICFFDFIWGNSSLWQKKVIMPKTEISTSMSAWFWLRAVLLVWSANMRKTQVTEPRSRAKDGHLNKENTVELVENSGGLT